MKQPSLQTALAPFVVGMLAMYLLISYYNRHQANALSEASQVSLEATRKCLDANEKWGKYNSELFFMAKTYQETKDTSQKIKLADSLAYKIREYGLTGSL